MRHLTSEIGQIIYQTKASNHDIKDDRNFNFVPILKRCMRGSVTYGELFQPCFPDSYFIPARKSYLFIIDDTIQLITRFQDRVARD